MVHTSKPYPAKTFISEYSPLPGTVRSKLGFAEREEPWTRKSTGRARSPAFGRPLRLRYNARETSPFFAAYSALHIGPFDTGLAWATDDFVASPAMAPRPIPAPESNVRRDMTLGSGITGLLRGLQLPPQSICLSCRSRLPNIQASPAAIPAPAATNKVTIPTRCLMVGPPRWTVSSTLAESRPEPELD